MKITTIATKECEVGLQRAVASLRNHGNTSVVDVYVPERYTPPECERNQEKTSQGCQPNLTSFDITLEGASVLSD